ncbi:MAG: hypothetical protein RIS11_421, partial [Pseudomonadota bacterium]
PVAIASTTAGVFLVRRVSPARFQLLVSGLMIILGAELIRQAIW